MYDQYASGMMTIRHRSLVGMDGRHFVVRDGDLAHGDTAPTT